MPAWMPKSKLGKVFCRRVFLNFSRFPNFRSILGNITWNCPAQAGILCAKPPGLGNKDSKEARTTSGTTPAERI